MRRLIVLVFAVLALAGSAADALALHPHVRDGWLLGLSYGNARGKATGNIEGETEDGVSPGIRFGRMISKRFALGLSYSGWLYEEGEIPVKFRYSMQNLGAALSWYPGDPESGLGGFYARLGVGHAWASLAAVEIHPEEEQGHGGRVTETGVGVEFVLGYEFRIARGVAVGLSSGSTRLDIGGEFYDEAEFFPFAVNLGWYF